MSSVMIKCPQTGKELSTGIETDSENYAMFPDALVFTYCSYCGLKHAWRHEDAWLADESPLQPSIDNVPKPPKGSTPDPSG